MPDRWLIVADDLTGAADSGVAFAQRGLVTEVSWGATPRPLTRGRGAGVRCRQPALMRRAKRGRRHRDALRALPRARHGAVQENRLDAARPARGGNRRAVRGAAGIRRAAFGICRAGKSRHGAEHARRPCVRAWQAAGETRNLAPRTHLCECGPRRHSGFRGAASRSNCRWRRCAQAMRGLRKQCRRLRAAAAHGPGGIAICDAENDDDLDRIAAARVAALAPAFVHRHRRVWRRHWPAQGPPPAPRVHQARAGIAGTLVVVGSPVQRFARRGAASWRRMRSVRASRIDGRRHCSIRNSPRRMFAHQRSWRALMAGQTTWLLEPVDGGEPDLAQAPRLVRTLAATLRAGAVPHGRAHRHAAGRPPRRCSTEALVQRHQADRRDRTRVSLGRTRGERQVAAW